MVRVALDVPLAGPFDYLPPTNDPIDLADIGRRVVVSFGRRRLAGIVLEVGMTSDWPVAQLKPIERVDRVAPPVPAEVLTLAGFAADYYRAHFGEVLLPALPPALRTVRAWRTPRYKSERTLAPDNPPQLTLEQSVAVRTLTARLDGAYSTTLLHGITGSGKTEVYLRLIDAVLQADGQVLVLVPEINLVPQMLERVQRRFPMARCVAQHSGLADGERLAGWLAAQSGAAQVVVGTRLAVFTPLPKLALTIVDEEHDPSYKQQDGPRLHARDLALWRASARGIPVVLGSATPSLETWARAQTGAIERLTLPFRARATRLPAVRLIDLRRGSADGPVSGELLQALRERVARGEQSLLFINRRGYAPTLRCSCGWQADCHRCSAHLVLHRNPHQLRCHHCGAVHRVPRVCPDCGNQDLRPLGQATQRIETLLADLLPGARVARVDRDSVRRRDDWPQLQAAIEAGAIDVLVGTQMLTKGHDFAGITLVGVVDADSALYASDFRAPERLFAQLLQVAGRAGRGARPGEVLIQTRLPEHPLFAALQRGDFAGFAASELAERQRTGLPPYGYLALVRAEASSDAACEAFLSAVAQTATDLQGHSRRCDAKSSVQIFDPVPSSMARIGGQHRWQLMLQSVQRPALRALLGTLAPQLHGLAGRRVRWSIDVDPQQLD